MNSILHGVLSKVSNTLKRRKNDLEIILYNLLYRILPKMTNIFKIRKKAEVVVVFKQSGSPWILDQIINLLESGRLESLPRYAASIERISKDMIKSVAGKVRKTSFRHQMVEMDSANVVRGVSSPRLGRILLWELINMIKPQRAIELGSAFGIGTMYMTDAMLKNGIGKLDGIEYEDWRATLANKMLETHFSGIARVHTGRIEDILPTLIHKYDPVDFAFVDAVHKYEDCIAYHELLSGAVAEGATVVYDDINFSSDMLRFWNELVSKPNITDAILIRKRWGIVRYARD